MSLKDQATAKYKDAFNKRYQEELGQRNAIKQLIEDAVMYAAENLKVEATVTIPNHRDLEGFSRDRCLAIFREEIQSADLEARDVGNFFYIRGWVD